MLGSLPTKGGDEEGAGLSLEAYHIAMAGATRYGLNLATKAALRGEHGHTFYPSPAELLQLYQAAMRPIDERQRRERAVQEISRIADSLKMIDAQRTPEAIARQKATYQRFCKQHEERKAGERPVTFDWQSVHRRFDDEAREVLKNMCRSDDDDERFDADAR